MRLIERLAALRNRVILNAGSDLPARAPETTPPSHALAIPAQDAFESYLAGYERRFRELAMRRAPNSAELKLIRAGWDDKDIRALLDEVVAGRVSATAAAVTLGWRKPKSPLQELCSAWKRATPEQRAEFRAYMAASPVAEAAP